MDNIDIRKDIVKLIRYIVDVNLEYAKKADPTIAETALYIGKKVAKFTQGCINLADKNRVKHNFPIGGIVTGDHIPAKLNGPETILTTTQQKSLLELISGDDNGGEFKNGEVENPD